MAEPAVIQITEPGGQPRRITVDRSVEVGSDCDGEVIADPSVSARHLKLVASPVALSLVDLGSSGGTFVNGQPAEGRIVLDAGDVVRFGGTDVAEHNGMVLGLWPIAAKQAEVAAANALGGDERLIAEVPATILKGVGLELSAVGRVEPLPGEEVVVIEDAGKRSYRRLVLADGQVMGAVILGHHPENLAAATTAVKRQLVLDDAARAAVQAGDWSALAAARQPADVAGAGLMTPVQAADRPG
jgi:nitrite reductase (NADH) large subunit